MERIGVPVRRGVEAARAFRLWVQPLGVLLAGSRSGRLPEALCRGVVRRLAAEGFSFLVGCAPGVDWSFRLALTQEGLARRSFVVCASRERLSRSCGLPASVVVAEGLSMAAAFHRRTVWMVTRCCMVVLFSEGRDGSWGPGSRLVLRTALEQGKPVFVASGTEPHVAVPAQIQPGSLYGLVSGWWVTPHAAHADALCGLGALT
jgi:hypothetical protein